MICHGQGDATTYDGCCWVDGVICPNRLKIVNGRVLQGPDLTDLGTTTQFINSLTNNGAARNRATAQVQGLIYACRAAINAIVADASILSTRAEFDAAWAARPEYQAIGNYWTTMNQPFDWCMSFGPDDMHCCHRETPAENAAKTANLSNTAVSIRRAARGAS